MHFLEKWRKIILLFQKKGINMILFKGLIEDLASEFLCYLYLGEIVENPIYLGRPFCRTD